MSYGIICQEPGCDHYADFQAGDKYYCLIHLPIGGAPARTLTESDHSSEQGMKSFKQQKGTEKYE